MERIFTVEKLRPIREGYTVSRDSHLGSVTKVTFFSLGSGTSISQETYDTTTLYIGASGEADFMIGEEAGRRRLFPDTALIVPCGTLCGCETQNGVVYTEVILKNTVKEINMNAKVPANEVFALRDLIDYEEGSITNLDIVSTAGMKYVLMAFDEGTGLTPHRAPGNAVVFALEGRAVIGYEGQDYELSAGECFKFEKNGLHSVTAQGRFKMALLLVFE